MYKHKYLKYKRKYFDTKKQQGGVNSIFDLDREYDFTDDVQKNIELLYELFGEYFMVTKGQISMPVKLRKLKGYFNKMSFYEMSYNDTQRTTPQMPFSILFYDMQTMELNNNTFIGFIHNTKDHTGSQIVNMVLDIQQKLNVNKTVLHDGATVNCGNDKLPLSFLKLLEKVKRITCDLALTLNFCSTILVKYHLRVKKYGIRKCPS